MDQANLHVDGYTIVSKVGGGGFGEVFLGKDDATGHEVRFVSLLIWLRIVISLSFDIFPSQVAIKVEQVGYREPQLRHEYKVYRELERRSAEFPTGFCRAIKFNGTEQYNYMVMDLLGSSLSDLFRNTCSKKFSLRTGKFYWASFMLNLNCYSPNPTVSHAVLQITDQVLERIEVFHSVNLIHRDISSVRKHHDMIQSSLLRLTILTNTFSRVTLSSGGMTPTPFTS